MRVRIKRKAWEFYKNHYIQKSLFATPMSSAFFSSYIESLNNPDIPSIPAVMDEDHVFLVLEKITGKKFMNYEDIQEWGIYNITIFDIPDGKKQFDIATVRRVIDSISLRPYQGKQIFILKNFHTAGHAAQNATLKMLEECPTYAAIILVCPTTTSLLETILSRVVILWWHISRATLDETTISLLQKALWGDMTPWISHLYQATYSREEVISILQMVYPHLNTYMKRYVNESMKSLWETAENPKHILDIIFISHSHIFSQ